MNIYNFIYCFFYRLWEKRGSDGRVLGSVHVLFTILMHLFLIIEIIRAFTGSQGINLMPRLGSYSDSKLKYTLFLLPFAILIFIYYNRQRTTALLKQYNALFGKQGLKNVMKIILFILIPTLALIILAIIRQRNYSILT